MKAGNGPTDQAGLLCHCTSFNAGIKYSQHTTSYFHAVILILVNIYGIKLTVQVTMLFSGLKLLAIVFIVAVGVITVGVRQSVPERLHQPFQPLECHEPSVSSVALALYGVLWAYDAW